MRKSRVIDNHLEQLIQEERPSCIPSPSGANRGIHFDDECVPCPSGGNNGSLEQASGDSDDQGSNVSCKRSGAFDFIAENSHNFHLPGK